MKLHATNNCESILNPETAVRMVVYADFRCFAPGGDTQIERKLRWCVACNCQLNDVGERVTGMFDNFNSSAGHLSLDLARPVQGCCQTAVCRSHPHPLYIRWQQTVDIARTTGCHKIEPRAMITVGSVKSCCRVYVSDLTGFSSDMQLIWAG